MTARFNIHEAKTNFSALIERVQAGEEIVVAKNGTPVARIVPIQTGAERLSGSLAGKIWMAEDFDAPLPEDFLISPGG